MDTIIITDDRFFVLDGDTGEVITEGQVSDHPSWFAAEDVGIDDTAIGGGGIDTPLCTCTERECVCVDWNTDRINLSDFERFEDVPF